MPRDRMCSIGCTIADMLPPEYWRYNRHYLYPFKPVDLWIGTETALLHVYCTVSIPQLFSLSQLSLHPINFKAHSIKLVVLNLGRAMKMYCTATKYTFSCCICITNTKCCLALLSAEQLKFHAHASFLTAFYRFWKTTHAACLFSNSHPDDN